MHIRTNALFLTVLAACGSGDRREAGQIVVHQDSSPPPAAPAPTASPVTYRARFETSAGTFVIAVHRDWAPLGADRFQELIKSGYYTGVRFFRVLPGFMAQFGINGDPKVWATWSTKRLKDDPVRQSNTRGMVSFATAGPNTRTAQVFINFGDNRGLDGQGFAPFGEVVDGMAVVDRLYAAYGEGAPDGSGPDQQRIWREGNRYLERGFSKLDYIKHATLLAP